MSASIAGATTIGAFDANTVAVMASSVIPSANLASKLAVVGAITMQWAFVPSATWSMLISELPSQREVVTGLWLRAPKVLLPMKR